MNFTLILVFLGVASVAAYFAFLAEKKRTEAFAKIAIKLGASALDSVPLPPQALGRFG